MNLFKIVAVAVVSMLPALAVAQTAGPDLGVTYADLDLRTAAGLNALDARLDAAIRARCPSAADSIDPTIRRAARACIATQTLVTAAKRDRILAEAQAAGRPADPSYEDSPELRCRSC